MSTQTIDPRIAAAGGSPARPNRTDTRGGYNYSGMASAAHWAQTAVHQATHWYGCAFCGQKFKGPHAVYTHIAKRHPKRSPHSGRGSQEAASAAQKGQGEELVGWMS
jgi:hypothetical protein